MEENFLSLSCIYKHIIFILPPPQKKSPYATGSLDSSLSTSLPKKSTSIPVGPGRLGPMPDRVHTSKKKIIFFYM